MRFPGLPWLVSAFTVGARRSCSDCLPMTMSSTLLWVSCLSPAKSLFAGDFGLAKGKLAGGEWVRSRAIRPV
jgi:hypothetical protein